MDLRINCSLLSKNNKTSLMAFKDLSFKCLLKTDLVWTLDY